MIAADEAAMRALADTVAVVRARGRGAGLPGVGLPALRPRLARAAGDGRAPGDAARAAAKRNEPQLLVATANAATQRAADTVPDPPAHPPPRRGRADRARRAGRAAERPRLPAHRCGRRAGEYAVRGSIVDLFPAGEEQALRLDFFGDEIETMRRFDPGRPALDRQGRCVHADAGVARHCSTRRRSSASAPAIARQFGANCDRRPALPGVSRRAPPGRDGALAAAVRGEAVDPVRPSRRE